MKDIIFPALEKAFGSEGSLPAGRHKLDLSVTVVDNLNGDIISGSVKGEANKGEDYERLATVSVSLYEALACFASLFGISGDEAIEKAAKALGKALEKKMDGAEKTLSKKIKDKVEEVKEAFAQTLPMASVKGRTDFKLDVALHEETENKAI